MNTEKKQKYLELCAMMYDIEEDSQRVSEKLDEAQNFADEHDIPFVCPDHLNGLRSRKSNSSRGWSSSSSSC